MIKNIIKEFMNNLTDDQKELHESIMSGDVMHQSIDSRPLTRDIVMAMTVKEFIDYIMAWPEIKENYMGEAHLPWMEFYYPDGMKSTFKIHFSYMNDHKSTQPKKENNDSQNGWNFITLME